MEGSLGGIFSNAPVFRRLRKSLRAGGLIRQPLASRQRIQWIVVTSAITAMTSLIPIKGTPGPMPGEDAKVNY